MAAYETCRAIRDLETITQQHDGRYPFDPRLMPTAAWSDLRDAAARLAALLTLAPKGGGPT